MTHSVGWNSLGSVTRSFANKLKLRCKLFWFFQAQHRHLVRTALQLISTLSDRTRKQKLFINAFSKTTKREIERLPKTEEKISVDKKTATVWTCMYDFIRPKMETYFSRHYGDQKFEFLTSVSLQIRARAHFFLLLRYHIDKRARSRGKRKKKHQKCSEEFKWFKVFAGQVLCAKRETKQWYENLLMKFFLRDFRTRKTKNRRIFRRQGETLSSGRVFFIELGHEDEEITTKPERTTSNEYYTILGCPFRPWSNISITYDENV